MPKSIRQRIARSQKIPRPAVREREDDNRCPVCKDSFVIYDYETAELYCTKCGLVLS